MIRRMDIDKIKKNLNTEYIGRKITYVDTTGSTNDDAKAAGAKGEEEGGVFIAEHQTKGRGRMFRSWITEPYTSLAMTVLLKPCIRPEDAPTMTPVLAVSAVEAIKETTGIEAGIKWPNDIFADGRKLGGILTEMSIEPLNAVEETENLTTGMYVAKIKYIVAGIGLNINQEAMDGELDGIAASLKMIASKSNQIEFNREELAAAILNRFELNYKEYLANGLSCFSDRLKKYSVVLGKEVVVISGLEMVEGTAEDIDESGNLVLRLEDGRLKKIIYGDVGLKYKDSIMDRR